MLGTYKNNVDKNSKIYLMYWQKLNNYSPFN